MTTHGEPRERSPAYRGARLAFSTSSATSRSRENNDDKVRGALVAANLAGNWTVNDHRIVKDTSSGRDLAMIQERQTNTPSYVAANVAARLSTEQLPLFTTTSPLGSRPRPSPSRAQSDMTVRRRTNTQIVNTLVNRYDGDSAVQIPRKTSPRRRVSSNDAQEQKNRPPIPKLLNPSSHSIESSYAPAPEIDSARYPHKDASIKIHPGPTRSRTSLLLPTSTTPQLSVSSLADAMVASSLASSRAPSPTDRGPPPLPPPRRGSRPSLFHRTHSAENEENRLRTPSPSKGTMRQTMRVPLESAEDFATKHSRNRFINKHPNKHHEGDRKRWRDQITELERKRYEGVWAANRGLLMSKTNLHEPSSRGIIADSGNGVLNIVVRDIWSRSKLPMDILAEVWDLVTMDRDTGGVLGKEEFVVGMWLVDQRLKGRKLPGKVSDSVWFSARGLTGIKVKGRH